MADSACLGGEEFIQAVISGAGLSMAQREDHWVDNSGVRLHYFDSEKSSEIPILFVPGVSESAEDYSDVIGALPDIRCVAITFRGRGKSGVPSEGYSLSDHVSDVESVVNNAKLARFCLVGVSRGVSYAAAFAIKHPEMIAGLIVCDYPIKHTRLPKGWVDWFWTSSWLGKAVTQRMAREAVAGLQRDSAEVPLLEELAKLDCPVLIMRGAQKGSGLPQDEAEKTRLQIKRSEVIVFEQSGHNLRSPDSQRFVGAIRDFHDRLQ